MDAAEFRQRGKEMVDYLATYMETLGTRRVTPEVEPGYLRNLLPAYPPKKGEDFDKIMKDVDRAIMPGVSPSDLALMSKKQNKRISTADNRTR